MRIISLHTDILDRKHADQLSERGRRCAQFARDAARRMQTLLDNLDLCASVRRGTFQRVPVDMEELTDEVVERLEGEHEDVRGSVFRQPLPVVSGERSQLDKVLHNILDNSIKFQGPDPLRIGISAQQVAEEWIFSVTDNGIGIPDGFTERIFQIFQRYHSAGEHSGAGVGLSIARSVVHLHCGRIWAQSHSGPGATLCFTLPVSVGRLSSPTDEPSPWSG
jgi:light-regulated signal transduction histidine kinase (bacteriophytochrome)